MISESPESAAREELRTADIRLMTDREIVDVLKARASHDANSEFGVWLGRLLTAWVTDSPLTEIDAILNERLTLSRTETPASMPEAPYCPKCGVMVADDEMGRSWHCNCGKFSPAEPSATLKQVIREMENFASLGVLGEHSSARNRVASWAAALRSEVPHDR